MRITQLLLFSFVLFGIFLLIRAIRLLQKTFNGKIIIEIPFTTKEANFTISKKCIYAIWDKGHLFKKTPAGKFKPTIYNKLTKENIQLHPSIVNIKTKNGSIGRRQLYTFSADAGNYVLQLTAGSSVSKIESAISEALPIQSINHNKYFIQIRESQPFYFIIIGILLILLSAGCIACGIIFGIKAQVV